MALHFADELFHFVGFKHPEDDERNFNVLVDILRVGCVSYPPHEDNWGETRITVEPTRSLLRNEMVVPNMVCFCDILPEHLGGHMQKYGRFGLSIAKSYAIKYGTRPVMYIPYRSDDRGSPYGTQLLLDIEAAIKSFDAHRRATPAGADRRSRLLGHATDSPRQTMELLAGKLTKDMLGFVKAFDSELPDSDPAYYYAEREWRRLGNLKFEGRHIKHIVLAPGFENRLAPEFASYSQKLLALP